MTMREMRWDDGDWTVEPESSRPDGNDLLVVPRAESDWWRTTSYGFVHDDAHALLADLPDGSAVEVSWVLDYGEQFDQAGVAVYADDANWVKAGIERADGALQVGAVATRGMSDWSTFPVPQWTGLVATVRASRAGDALTVRVRVADGPWHLLRLTPLDPALPWRAGPFCCSPTRGGLTVRFTRWAVGDADQALH